MVVKFCLSKTHNKRNYKMAYNFRLVRMLDNQIELCEVIYDQNEQPCRYHHVELRSVSINSLNWNFNMMATAFNKPILDAATDFTGDAAADYRPS